MGSRPAGVNDVRIVRVDINNSSRTSHSPVCPGCNDGMSEMVQTVLMLAVPVTFFGAARYLNLRDTRQ